MIFPKPDRSDYTPNFRKTEENDTIDIGWTEGVMSDGRPYRAECWARDQMTCLTIMFSRRGFEGATEDTIVDLLEMEGIIRFKGPKRPIEVRPFEDAGGNDLLVADVVVGDEESLYVEDNVSLKAWEPR